MKNVFQKVVDLNALENVAVCDYTPKELVAYLTTKYPYDPMGALQYMRENYIVGLRLGEQSAKLLEGLGYAKRN